VPSVGILSGREPPFREDLSAEAEESPLLVAVTRERLVKTEQAGKDLAGAVVICISDGAVIARTYELCAYKWSTNPITNPKPRL
jgi:hypothetical protein